MFKRLFWEFLRKYNLLVILVWWLWRLVSRFIMMLFLIKLVSIILMYFGMLKWILRFLFRFWIMSMLWMVRKCLERRERLFWRVYLGVCWKRLFWMRSWISWRMIWIWSWRWMRSMMRSIDFGVVIFGDMEWSLFIGFVLCWYVVEWLRGSFRKFGVCVEDIGWGYVGCY